MTIGLLTASVAASSFVSLLLYKSNEFYSFDSLYRQDERFVWGPAFSQMDAAFKLNRTKHLKPDVLFLGSSRATQFRAEMFRGARFYNAGGATGSIPALDAFLRELDDDSQPKVAVISVDPWWFDINRGFSEACKAEGGTCIEFSYAAMVANVFDKASDPRFLIDLLSNTPTGRVDPISNVKAYGYRALKWGEGYREDGSHQRGMFILDVDPYFDILGMGYRNGFEYFINQARTRTGRFAYTGALPVDRLQHLEGIVENLQSRKTEVVLVLQPFAKAFYSYLMSDPAQRNFIQDLETQMASLADRQGIEYFNFHDLRSIGQDDSHMMDGIHKDEVATIHLANILFSRSAVLARRINLDQFGALYHHVTSGAYGADKHLNGAFAAYRLSSE
ncbi:MAG: hypothetical protein HOI95_21075 [Chromatiales bacterium]|nr:hypothetical protein [Chromatiales bacterium]